MVVYDSRDAGLPRGLCKGGYNPSRLAWASPFACVKPNRRGGALAGSKLLADACTRPGVFSFPPTTGEPCMISPGPDREGISTTPPFRSNRKERAICLSRRFSPYLPKRT